MAITANRQLLLTAVLFVGTEVAILTSGRKGCAGRVPKGKLVTSTSLCLALARLRITECEGVAVGREFVRSKLKSVVVDLACTPHVYVSGIDEGG